MKKLLTTGLLTGIACLFTGLVMSRALNFVFPILNSEYQNPALFRPWTDPLMSLYFGYPFIFALTLTFIWTKANHLFFGNPFRFALSYWLLTNLPGMFMTYSSFPVSLVMVLSWSLSSLAQTLVAALLLSRVSSE